MISSRVVTPHIPREAVGNSRKQQRALLSSPMGSAAACDATSRPRRFAAPYAATAEPDAAPTGRHSLGTPPCPPCREWHRLRSRQPLRHAAANEKAACLHSGATCAPTPKQTAVHGCARTRGGRRRCHPLLSAPNGPPTDSRPRGIASQPLFQPPGTAFGKALLTPLVSPCLSQAPPPLPESPPPPAPLQPNTACVWRRMPLSWTLHTSGSSWLGQPDHIPLVFWLMPPK